MTDVTVIATAAISGAVGIFGALIASRATQRAVRAEADRQRWEYQRTRRQERQETYQQAVDLITDWGWRSGDRDYDVVRDLTIPFIRAGNRIRIYGSPASIAAFDKMQDGFALSNRAQTDAEAKAAQQVISGGLDELVNAARADVGPKEDDELEAVPFRTGAGPSA